jgi:hypothetical protein
LNGGGTGWENVGCSLFQAELLAIAGLSRIERKQAADQVDQPPVIVSILKPVPEQTGQGD